MFVVPAGEGAEGGAAAEGAPGPADRTVEGAEPELLQAPPPAPHQHFFRFFFFFFFFYTVYKFSVFCFPN